jgi:hypothetical protein
VIGMRECLTKIKTNTTQNGKDFSHRQLNHNEILAQKRLRIVFFNMWQYHIHINNKGALEQMVTIEAPQNHLLDHIGLKGH